MKEKNSIKDIFENNIYALRLIFKNCPFMVIYKLLYSVMNGLLATIDVYFLSYTIKLIESGAGFSKVILYVLLLMGIIIAYNCATLAVNAKIMPYYSYKTNSVIRAAVYKQAAHVDLKFYEDPKYYNDLNLAVTEGISRIEQVLDSLSYLLSSLATLFSISVLTYMINPVVMLFYCIPIIVMLLDKKRMDAGFALNKKINAISRRNDYFNRCFTQKEYAEELRTTGISLPLIKHFRENMEQAKKVYKTDGMRVAVVSFCQSVVTECAMSILIYVYVAYQTLVKRTMQFGDCIVLVKAVSNVDFAVQGVLENIMVFREHSMYIGKLRDFLNDESTIENSDAGVSAENGDIEFRNVSFRYSGSSDNNISRVSFRINKGEKVAIVGHNGAGKTTLIKLLLRLYDPDSGEILVNGSNIRDYALKSYRGLFGVMFQDFKHFSMSISENVLFRSVDAADKEIVRASITKSGLENRVNKLPKAEDSILGREFDSEGAVLSGGEAQKLALARIIASNRDILVLDEPSSALDPIAEDEMYSTLYSSFAGRTMIFISHRMSSTVNADKILFVENGAICEMGSHSELMHKNGKYAEMFRIQADSYKKD